jgi:hypothetical protein
MPDRRIEASVRPALWDTATKTNRGRRQGMGTRPAADDMDGATAHPRFVGADDQGHAGLAANIVVRARAGHRRGGA